ncbi:MAG TPA: DUF1990 family protein [Dehalococcoidia bacterium]|nr:DUF1990 family protein [Dehalococcoidia bacterium]
MQLSSLNNSTSVITLSAFLNTEIEELLFTHLREVLQSEKDRVILDFRPVDHMNSAGVSALVKLAAMAKQNRAKLFAYGLNKRYGEILALTGLYEGIQVLDSVHEAVEPLSRAKLAELEKMDFKAGRQSDAGWAPEVPRIKVAEKPEGAFAKNMDGRRIIGQFQGFGPMWEKTYWLNIKKAGIKKEDIVLAMQEHFVEFQPSKNSFYPTNKGIAPGEIIFIDSRTPGGIVSTGVMVLYVDDRSFTFITPQGHPEAGWVTFSIDESEDSIYVQIQGLARASDPFFEIAFKIAGSKFQETIWKHVLSSLAKYLGVEENVQMKKYCIATDLQWSKVNNIWYNSQIRSLPLNIATLFKRSR